MAIDTNNRNGMSVFARAPDVPSNLGKIDVGAVYDAVQKNLANSTALTKNTIDTAQAGSNAQTTIARNTAARSVLPSQTAADIATNQGVVQDVPVRSGILAGIGLRSEGTRTSDIAAQNAKNNETKLQSDLSSIYTKAGLKYGGTEAEQIEQAKKTLLGNISSAPGGLYNQPIVGPNGTPIGSVIGYMGPNGPEVHAMPIPFGQLARIGTGIKYAPIGVINDPQTGMPLNDQYQEITTNAAGGITRGNVVSVAHGQPPPGDLFQTGSTQGTPAPSPTGSAPSLGAGANRAAQPASASGGTSGSPGILAGMTGIAAPVALAAGGGIPGASNVGTTVPGGRLGAQFQQKQAEERTKQRQEALQQISSARDSLSQNTFAIGKLAQDIEAEQKSTLGSGQLMGNALVSQFRPTARAVNADLSNFVSQVMASAKNIRTQKEFNAYVGSIPAASDPAAVQNEKLAYLKASTNTLSQRNDYKERLLRNDPTVDIDQADQAAVQKFPFPVPEGGWTHNPDGTPIAPSVRGPDNGPNTSQADQPQPGSAASPPSTVVSESIGVSPGQARAMPAGVSYYIRGGPTGPDGRPIVYQNAAPQVAAAQGAPAAQ